MSKLALLIGLFSLSLLFVGSANADDSDLGFLPPLPNLDLGDPEREPSWSQKRRARIVAQKEMESEKAQSNVQKPPSVPLKDRLKLASQNNQTKQRSRFAKVDVNNSISSQDDAYTASGNRLMPFGEENGYWAGMPAARPDEVLVDLPPMPDLRTPDQVTGKERKRNRFVAKQEARNSQAVAKREEAERERTATVSRPAADPDSALVLVESQRMDSSTVAPNQEVPETLNKGKLKPFNSGSVFYKNNEKVYQGDGSTNRFQFPWNR